MKPLSLFGDGINAYSPAVSRQRRLNCFYDVRLDKDKNAVIIRGTPGSVVRVTLPTAPLRGWWVALGILYVVGGSVLYSVSAGYGYAALGSLSTNVGPVDMADNSLQLGIVDGLHGYIYTMIPGSYSNPALNAHGAFGVILDPNFPQRPTSITFLSERFIVNRGLTRQFYESEQFDGTLWTNPSFLPTYGTKETSSDLLQAVDVVNGTLLLYGSKSTEFWQDVGTFPLNVAIINGATQPWGLAAVQSRAFLNSTVYFLGQTGEGGPQVVKMQGYTPVPVSTTDIENIIAGFSTWADATALAYMVDGHSMYQINFPTAGRSFLLDTKSGFWGEVQTGLALQAPHFANIGITFNTLTYAADTTTGNIYQMSTAFYTDSDTPIKRQVASRHVYRDNNEFGISELVLDMETGVGLPQGQGVAPQIMMQVSKDYGRTFGPEKWKSLGAMGVYLWRVRWPKLGSSRDFVFQFTMTDPVKFTIIRGDATLRQEEGKNG